MEVKDIIKSRREELGLTMKELASKVGVSEGTISRWESGDIQNMRRDKVAALSKVLNLAPAVIMGWDTDTSEKKVVPIRVPVLGRVAAGIPVAAITDVIDYEELDPRKFSPEEKYFALQIHGDSMEPRMKEGDVVIVRQQSDVESGDIAIVRVDGYDATCKKILKQDDGILLVGFNPSFTPIFYSCEQISRLPVEIAGKVIELRAKF